MVVGNMVARKACSEQGNRSAVAPYSDSAIHPSRWRKYKEFTDPGLCNSKAKGLQSLSTESSLF